MVDGLRTLLCRIDPRLHHFKDEEIVFVDEARIDHFAFEVGEALGHEGRRYSLGWKRSQTESFELGYIAPRAVAHPHDLRR